MLRLKNCQDCGIEYMGGPTGRYCPECRHYHFAHSDKKNRLIPEEPGWRHMIRDTGGPALRPGGNVVHALRTLCDYEDICEAAGIHGPEELRKAMEAIRSKEERSAC